MFFCASFLIIEGAPLTSNIDKLLFWVIWVDFSVDFAKIKLGWRHILCAFMPFLLICIVSGAYVIDKPAEIEKVLMTLLAGDKVCSSAEKENRRASGFLKDEFLTTKAELDALLEVQSDEKL